MGQAQQSSTAACQIPCLVDRPWCILGGTIGRMLCRRGPEFWSWLQRGPKEGVINIGGCGGGLCSLIINVPGRRWNLHSDTVRESSPFC